MCFCTSVVKHYCKKVCWALEKAKICQAIVVQSVVQQPSEKGLYLQLVLVYSLLWIYQPAFIKASQWCFTEAPDSSTCKLNFFSAGIILRTVDKLRGPDLGMEHCWHTYMIKILLAISLWIDVGVLSFLDSQEIWIFFLISFTVVCSVCM